MNRQNWNCKVCTYLNIEKTNFCLICNAPYFEIESNNLNINESLILNDLNFHINKLYNQKYNFVIFTTGMADEGINKFWFSKKYINHLLNLIPRNFKQISVFHFDPNYFNYKINKLVNLSTNEPKIIKNNRFKQSFFYNIPFPFSILDLKNLNHILIDFAHIFTYDIDNGIPITSTHYKKYQTFKKGIKLPNLNSVYFGYLGGSSMLQSLAFSNFININIDGSSENYIQKMTHKKIKFDPIYPYEGITNFISKLIDQTLITLYKKKYNDSISFFDHTIRNSFNLNIKLIPYILNHLFQNYSLDQDQFKELIRKEGNEYFTSIGKPLI